MKAEHIQKALAMRPFRPIEFELESGQRFVVRHPEVVFVRETIVVVDVDGEIEIFGPEAVTSLTQVRSNGPRSRRKR